MHATRIFVIRQLVTIHNVTYTNHFSNHDHFSVNCIDILQVWPGAVYFPDYSNPNTQTWWTQECVLFHDQLAYDGLWIVSILPMMITYRVKNASVQPKL